MSRRDQTIAQLRREGLDVTEWHDERGAIYEEHSHPQLEVRFVLSGSMTITIDEVDHELTAGNRIDIPADAQHSAVVGPSGVHYLAGTKR